MCGRYQIDMTEPQNFKKRFKVSEPTDMQSRYNISPSQVLPIILPDNKLEMMKWGLVPFWERDKEKPHGLINVRDDTAVSKSWAHKYLQFQRCIVPASGFYEWKKTSDGKIPYYIHLKDKEYFSFAGMYTEYKHPKTGEELKTYTILTTHPNGVMKDIHNRMPVMLDEETEEKWLNPDMSEIEEIKKYLKPYSPKEMEAFPISTRVNSPVNDDKNILNPI